MSILQELYDSEINFAVSTFWDGGFDVQLGDYMNGYLAEVCVDRWEQVEPWLEQAALEHCPNSTFARNRQKASESAP
jgi:hypothetical protein